MCVRWASAVALGARVRVALVLCPPLPHLARLNPTNPHDRQHRPHRQRHPLLSVGRRPRVSISASPLTRLLPLPSLVRLSDRRPIHARTTRRYCQNLTDKSIESVAQGCPNMTSLNVG